MATNNPFFGIKVSKPGVPVSQATDKQLVFKDSFTSKIWYDNKNARIIEGQLPDGTYGLWVSKVGQDVTNANASINNNLIFNSNDKTFDVVRSGTTSITVPNPPSSGVNYSVTIAHNLGYAPGLVVYINSAPATAFGGIVGNIPTPVQVITASAQVLPTTDVTNLYVNIYSSTVSNFISGTWNFTYYLTRITSQ